MAPGLDAPDVAPWLNLTFATLGVMLLAQWSARTLGADAAVALSLAVTFWPSAAVFQMAYTEGLALLLLVATWVFLAMGRFGAASVAIVALSLTRPLAVPLAGAVFIAAFVIWRRERSWSSVRGHAGVVGAAGLATIAWPVYAGVHSGDPAVYFTAHNSYAKPGTPVSFAAWGLEYTPIGLLLLLVVTLTTLIGLGLMPAGTPVIVRVWAVLYPPYLFVGSLITPSLLRYFVFAFPLALCFLALVKRSRSRIALALLAVGLGVVAGEWWVREFMPPVPDGVFP